MIEPVGLRAALVRLQARAEHRARRPRAGTIAAWNSQAEEIGALIEQIDAPAPLPTPEPERCHGLDLQGAHCVHEPHHVGSCKPGRVA